jgi:hypothetical protein
MHAVVVRVNVPDPENSQEELKTRVVPAVSQSPGFVAGYWTLKDNKGLSMTVYESEDAARQASERVGERLPQGVELQDVEVREVVANA